MQTPGPGCSERHGTGYPRADQENEAAKRGEEQAISEVVFHSTRHILSTTFTTMAGFTPLIVGGGGFWPPLAIAIAGGVAGATILALYFVPATYMLLMKMKGPSLAVNADSIDRTVMAAS